MALLILTITVSKCSNEHSSVEPQYQISIPAWGEYSGYDTCTSCQPFFSIIRQTNTLANQGIIHTFCSSILSQTMTVVFFDINNKHRNMATCLSGFLKLLYIWLRGTWVLWVLWTGTPWNIGPFPVTWLNHGNLDGIALFWSPQLSTCLQNEWYASTLFSPELESVRGLSFPCPYQMRLRFFLSPAA